MLCCIFNVHNGIISDVIYHSTSNQNSVAQLTLKCVTN